jgi:hypothetical protein
MKKSLVLVAAGALAAVAGLAAFRSTARAAGDSTFVLGGLQVDKTSVPELVVFNTGQAALPPVTVSLLAADGSTLTTEPPMLTFDLGPHATGTIDLKAALAHAGLNGRQYAGLVTARLTGDAVAFTDQTAIVHATQYFGSRKKPRAGFVVRPLFIPGT